MWYKNEEEFMETCGYDMSGAWFPRVTRILSVKAKPALEYFFKEVGNYNAVEDIKNRSAEEGSLVHDMVQKVVVGESVDVPERVRPAVEKFLEFNEKRGIRFHPDHIERQVWSQLYRYAGTVDALATVDGKFGVLDIKTSTGFYPEYNLQTGAYIQALHEYSVKQALGLPRDVETRWILRIDQHRICKKCGARLREKGGRSKIKNGRSNGIAPCAEGGHEWGDVEGIVELREFPYYYRDVKAFLAAKTLWEWENDYWLRKIGYLK